MNIFCKLLGHKWRYKNYANIVKNDGDRYLFSASRKCKRCNVCQYKYDEWVEKQYLIPSDRLKTFEIGSK